MDFRKLVSGLRWTVDKLIILAVLVGGVALVFVTMLIMSDVLGASLLNRPIRGSLDMSTMAMSLIVFSGMAFADLRGGHIAVDLFQASYPPLMNKILDVLIALIGATLFALMAWRIYHDSVTYSRMFNPSTQILYIRHIYFQWIVSGLAAVTALSMLLRAVEVAIAPNQYRKAASPSKSSETPPVEKSA